MAVDEPVQIIEIKLERPIAVALFNALIRRGLPSFAATERVIESLEAAGVSRDE